MMTNPKISVIISTYNRADLLPRAIASVLNQTFKNFELIVVDDGSTDNTRKVVNEFQTKYKNVQYIWQEHSRGAAKPKNTGIKNAEGKYIAILDSDDEWLPKKLERQVNLFESSKCQNLGFIGCNSIVVEENGETLDIHRIPFYKDHFRNILRSDYMGSGSGMIYKRSVFDKVGLFDESLKTGQDWEMRIRILKIYDFAFANEPLFRYYIHRKSITETIDYMSKIHDLCYVVEKHQSCYNKFSKIYSEQLRVIGTYYILDRNIKKARKFFVKAISVYPYYIKTYINLSISFLGVNFFRNLLLIKRRLTTYYK